MHDIFFRTCWLLPVNVVEKVVMQMRRLSLLVFLLGSIVAINAYSAQAREFQPFTSDGCSRFPDGDFKNKVAWLHCCVDHDIRYWVGGTYQDRLEADHELRRCVIEAEGVALGDLMFAGVRMGGSPYLPSDFRWGYGWSPMRPYKKLSAEEVSQVREMLITIPGGLPTDMTSDTVRPYLYDPVGHAEKLLRWND